MAVTVAGLKRSHREMIDAGPAPSLSESGHSSTIYTPLGTPSRASSQAPNSEGSHKSRVFQSVPRKVSFEPSTSIVLVGVRGVGKSTLAILAASAYSRRVVDTERNFVDATGFTANAYRKAKGTSEYLRRCNHIFQSTLRDNPFGAVIVCTFADLEGNGAVVLQDYAQSHPVVHITRDLEGVSSVFRTWTSERINNLLTTSASLLHSCSNYEFFNLTDGSEGGDSVPHSAIADSYGNTATKDSFLTLKRVERDFLRLLRNIIGDFERGQSHHSAYPFSQVKVERREYTFAVTITASQVLQGSINFDDVQIGADCVELCAELGAGSRRRCLKDISEAFAIVRRATILPIMLSVDQGRSLTSEVSLPEVFELFLRLGAELCAVDLALTDTQLRPLITSKGHSKVIGSLYISERPPQAWTDKSVIDTFTRAAHLGCDLVKITMPAVTVDDWSSLDTLRSHVKDLNLKPNLIAYSTGPKGRTSKCFNRTLTSVRPHCTPSNMDRNQQTYTDITAREITQALFAAFVFEPMQFFIFGGDVSYSLSPAMHNAAYEACGMRCSYEAVSSDDISALQQLVRAHDFGGTAITQPYKTTALGMLDALSPHAQVIGAVNTIIPIRELSDDGSVPAELEIIAQRHHQGPVKALYGFNTDWIGIRACIRKGLSPANTIRPQTTAVVCGAGGMGRSAIYSLISLGVRHIFVCNRTTSRATALAKHYNDLIATNNIPELRSDSAASTRVHVLESFQSSLPGDARAPTIIVCCVPRRTSDDAPTNFDLPEAWFRSPTGGVVVEVAYRQPMSPIAHQVRARAQFGWIFMDGYDVLPEQAFSQFELFTGRRAPRKLMRDEIKRHIDSEG